MPLSDAFEREILDWYNGRSTLTPKTTTYIGFHIGFPFPDLEAGDGYTEPTFDANYARIAITQASVWGAASSDNPVTAVNSAAAVTTGWTTNSSTWNADHTDIADLTKDSPSAGQGTIVLDGIDLSSTLATGYQIKIADSANGWDGTYTLLSDPTYDSGTGATTLVVDGVGTSTSLNDSITVTYMNRVVTYILEFEGSSGGSFRRAWRVDAPGKFFEGVGDNISVATSALITELGRAADSYNEF